MANLKEIVKIYEKLLIIPKLKPKPQFYIVPVGLVGSGKSTVLKPLSEKLNLLRVSGDEIRKVIIDNNGNLDDTWQVGNTLVTKYAELGYSIAHDTDGATPATRESIAKQAQEHDIKVIWIHINPPESFIINKLRNFEHSWLFEDADDAIATYYKRKHLHENLEIDFTYEFDTSLSNLDQQLDEAVKAIHQRLR